jgi:carbamate kinase
MRIVVALGGNALLERGERPDAQLQQHHVERACTALAPLCRRHEVVITHGNGPQVGVLAVESESDPSLSRGYPLDSIGAQTQGLIGYWIVQELGAAVPEAMFAALVCQTVVRADDPAFENPTKFVGQVYSEERARQLAEERGWQVRPDGSSWRRVVPSPLPDRIVELPVIERLLEAGVRVVCSGGGGIPVAVGPDGRLHGTEAVIDKDRSAALLAKSLGADALLILTDVDGVQVGFGTPEARTLHETSLEELASLALPAGSMGPKVEAVCDFVKATGRRAAIGRLERVDELLFGRTGTFLGALPDVGRLTASL